MFVSTSSTSTCFSNHVTYEIAENTHTVAYIFMADLQSYSVTCFFFKKLLIIVVSVKAGKTWPV
jgi:hypothetical protein